MKRINDHEIPIDGDRGQRQCRYIYTAALGIRDQMAQCAAECPAAHEGVERRKGNRKHAQQDVRESQIRDEYIRNGLHGAITQHHIAHKHVAKDAQHKDRGVEHIEEELHQWIMHDVQHVIRLAR